MASLATNVSDLATAVATEVKATRVAINGNDGTGTSRLNTAASTLVDAINEVDAAVASASGIDDTTIGTSSSWSSQKTSDEIDDAVSGYTQISDGTTSTTATWSSSKIDSTFTSTSTADRARANHTGTQSMDTVTESATGKILSATERTKLTGVATAATANQADSYLLDRTHHTGTQAASTITGLPAALINDTTASTSTAYSATKVDTQIGAAVSGLLGGAPSADLDTIKELGDALTADGSAIGTINTALSNRLRFDAPQTLDSTMQTQGQTNLGVTAASDIGTTSTDFAAIFVAGLT